MTEMEMKPFHTNREGSNDQDADKEPETNEDKFKHLCRRLLLHDKYHQKLKVADVLQLTARSCSIQPSNSSAELDLAHNFLQRLLMMDYTARCITIRTREQNYAYLGGSDLDNDADVFADLLTEGDPNEETSTSDEVHPMDVQMAVFYCADGFLKQLMVTKLSQCQYALPLLVPNPFTQQIEFPLWTFRQIDKTWKIKGSNGETVSTTQPVYRAETPMVAFFRFGSMSSSKSQLINSLINERHDTFFHRNCPGSSRTRVLMDGVVEIAWYCPSGKDRDKFTDCVAFCNLHGDAGDHERQLNILTEMASVNVVLLPQLDRNDIDLKNIKTVYTKPFIFLLTESDGKSKQTQQGKIKIGIKGRSQPEIIKELEKAIKHVLSHSSSSFKLEDIARFSESKTVRVDETDDDNCNRAKEAAKQILNLLKRTNLTRIKESLLPCQGDLWHQWCQKNKELHRPQLQETEMEINAKNTAMKKIREKQHRFGISEFLQLFLKEIKSPLNPDKRMYFLKWLGILLDERTSENLSALRHMYAMQWTKVLKLKESKDRPQQLDATELKELKALSDNVNSANFGLEHILREIGQIYESCSSVNKNKNDLPVHFSSLPSVAAEMMISGFPLELMDGDAAHVPLIWVTAVLDALINKLGDVSVFVLSVLGIQSSGKSTLLNTMFGLQFAVSAGRCTRGAFMQLVRLSEDMKAQLRFDYILVVDTEGLCSPELSGREIRNHDNELATFVVGIGNLTLINIFGENPVELSKVLQIVVQAFLRMKKVKLNPSCMFVHQNVSTTTKEKCIQARMRLQEELDEMTEIAAKDEVSDVQCFNDVIRFEAENDVKYFAQLWEGTPPMAPPCPEYSENAHDLKKTIVSKASQFVGMRLTHFKCRVQDLWRALLNENFVFSFRDCLEIAVYRRLETKYSTWTWKLRYAMLGIENNLLNKIENGKMPKDLENHLKTELKQTSEEVNNSMSEFFEKDRDAAILVQWKTSFQIKIGDVQDNIVRETRKKLNEVLDQQHLKEKIDAQKTHYEATLFERSKDSALQLKGIANNEETLKTEFDSFWSQWLAEIRQEMPSVKKIYVLQDMKQILGEMYGSFTTDHMNETSESIDITSVPTYADYVVFKTFRRRSGEVVDKDTDDNVRAVVTSIVKEMDETIRSMPTAKMGYNIVHIQEITDYIKRKVEEHEEQVAYVFKKEFNLDLTLHICKKAEKIFTDQHRIFWEANDPTFYFERKREQYYNMFKKYSHGVKSTAIFGEFICNKLKEPIQESAYKKTAKELADEMKTNCESFNGNRSKLEKHILETLAEKENFSTYMQYIHNPIEHFKSFIRDEVSKYISENFRVSILPSINKHIELQQQKIIEAAHEASQKKSGDVESWLKTFTHKLSDVLIFPEKTFTGVSRDDVDVNLLEEVIRKELPSVKFDTSRTFRIVNFLGKLDYKDRPDEILIEHFCRCCWVQCPFCKAICTNTIENHTRDHSVPFHRNIGLNGLYYRGTTNLGINICTSEVATDHSFYPNASADNAIPWKQYRTAGPAYADWSITPDLSELPYWKWFVCRFQKDLENYYGKTFQGFGMIPNEWRLHDKQSATASLINLL